MTFEQIRKVLKTKTIGIAGCGGLGSNCAVALVRSGIGKLVIADFDKIEDSNLNRQYFFYDQIGLPKADTLKENLLRIKPTAVIESHQIILDSTNIPQIFADCDIIVEAFDKTEMKEMIMKSVSKSCPDKYLVMGIGIAGWGANNLFSDKHFDKLIICGDGVNETSELNPPLAPRVGIVANMQANAVLELILGKNKDQVG